MLKIDKAAETVSMLIYGLKTKGGKKGKKFKRDKERQEVVEKVYSTWLRFFFKIQAFIKCYTANCYKLSYCVGGGYKNEL